MRPSSNIGNHPLTNSFSSAGPVVYRSLPVAIPSVSNSLFGSSAVVEKLPVKPVVPTRSSFPTVAFPALLKDPIVREEIDLQQIQKILCNLCSSCQLRRDASLCQLECVADVEDGNEQCKFTVSFWENSGKHFIQVDRQSGCPYLLRNVISKAFPEKTCANVKLFRAPKLPACMCTEEAQHIKEEDVNAVITLATSNVFEHRIQGTLVLADLCSGNTEFASTFRSCNGAARIAHLKRDSNRMIQRAVKRILTVEGVQ